jgi:hypothetical protein
MNKPNQASLRQRLADNGARQKLRTMAMDPEFNTVASYTANSANYPDNMIPFIDKHMEYLLQHPSVDVDQYIRNLRLSHRKRG